uniref:TnpV protein n=1 Tax=Anaerocolumna chitinilytica TaxID=1727145 RepID=UPI001CED5B72
MEYEEREGLWFGVVEEEKNNQASLNQLTKYGNLAMKYWEEEKPVELQQLLVDGIMVETMLKIQERAEQMMEQLQEQMMKEKPIKNPSDTMEAYRHRQRIHDQAEEIVLQEIVYN